MYAARGSGEKGNYTRPVLGRLRRGRSLPTVLKLLEGFLGHLVARVDLERLDVALSRIASLAAPLVLASLSYPGCNEFLPVGLPAPLPGHTHLTGPWRQRGQTRVVVDRVLVLLAGEVRLGEQAQLGFTLSLVTERVK